MADKEEVKKLISRIESSNNAQAINDWDSWSSGYDFNLAEADSYDLSNANGRAKKIIKDRKLESKMRESILDQVLRSADPYERYELIFNGVKRGELGLMDFSQVMGALQSGESFKYLNDEVDVTPINDD